MQEMQVKQDKKRRKTGYLQSVSWTAPCNLNILSFIFTFKSPFLIMPITKLYEIPGFVCSAWKF